MWSGDGLGTRGRGVYLVCANLLGVFLCGMLEIVSPGVLVCVLGEIHSGVC